MIEQQRVYVVDDDEAVRGALAYTLTEAGFDVRTCPTGSAFLDSFDAEESTCLVVDLKMPGMSGLELQHEMHERQCRVPIIMITGCADVAAAVRAMKDGAYDFIPKPIHAQELIDKVSAALRCCERQREEHVHHAETAARMERLTPRERQVMSLLVEGMISKQIARELGCSVRTIETHRSHLMRKMGVDTVASLVRVAIEARDTHAHEVFAMR